MDEKRYIFETVEITDDNGESRVVDVITDKEECYSYENLCDIAVLLNGKEATIQEQDKRIKELERMLKKCDAERIRLQNERGAIIKFGVRGGSV